MVVVEGTECTVSLLNAKLAHFTRKIGSALVGKESKVGMKLKPCPFCGRIDKLKVWKTEQHLKNGVIENWSVSCSAAGDETGCGGTGGTRRTKKEAVEAWNTRPERR